MKKGPYARSRPLLPHRAAPASGAPDTRDFLEHAHGRVDSMSESMNAIARAAEAAEALTRKVKGASQDLVH